MAKTSVPNVTSVASPRVFLSHASEDKERFVLPFAQQLRANGVDAWIDRWEMLPGDSLVDKIFVEGLASASAVIVVISKFSLTKRWVAEELDAAVVKRIEEGSKLIPIVLDGLEPSQIPVPIRHLLFESVENTDDLADVLDRVLRAIHGQPSTPPLGPAPRHTAQPAANIHGLDRIDSLVLRLAGDEAVRDGGTSFTTADFVGSAMNSLDVTEQQAIESLEVLDGDALIEIQRTLAAGLPGMRRFDLTSYGLETYLLNYRSDYRLIEETVTARLASWPQGQGDEVDLSVNVDGPRLIVRHILDRYASRGLVRVTKSVGGRWHFYSISPKLRRLAR